MNRAVDRCPNLAGDYQYTFQDLDYADNVVLFSTILDTLVDALGIRSEELSLLGLTNSWAKTKIQCKIQLPQNVNDGPAEVEVVKT